METPGPVPPTPHRPLRDEDFYDDETEEYTSWDPLKPKKPWRLIEVGLDDPEDLKKQVVDGSDPDSD